MRCIFGCILIVILFVAARSSAHMPPRQDPNEAVFTATQVVIVSPGKDYAFIVQQSYLGTLAAGSEIKLPEFRLVSFIGIDDDETPITLTDNTRILMFLEPDAKNPSAVSLTEYGYGYFFRDVSKIGELDDMAKKVVAARQKWQAARDIADHRERIAALLPFLASSSTACARLTLDDLSKLNPESGDYVASLLPMASPNDRLRYLRAIERLRTPKSHAAAIDAVHTARDRFNDFLHTNHLKSFDVTINWKTIPQDAGEASATVRSGLMAIHSFDDPSDLPYIRDLCPFLLNNGMDLSVEDCISMMGQMPDPANPAVLKSIWESCKANHHSRSDLQMLTIDLANSAGTQNDASAIPMLLELLDLEPADHECAMNSLQILTQKQFATAPEWKAWYASQHPAPAHPANPN